MGFGGIIQITVGFLIMADAIYKMIDFTLKWVVGYIRNVLEQALVLDDDHLPPLGSVPDNLLPQVPPGCLFEGPGVIRIDAVPWISVVPPSVLTIARSEPSNLSTAQRIS